MKFKNVTVYVSTSNGCEPFHKNNEYINYNESQVAEMFSLEKMPYMANVLSSYNLKDMESFNTYNHGSPFVFDGCAPRDIYENDSIAIVNIHLGGDVRGNYSEAYITEDIDSLLSQNSDCEIELSDGRLFRIDCDNSEAYFNLDSIDVYSIDFDKDLTEEQLEELEQYEV